MVVFFVLFFFVFSTSVLNSKCFSIYKDALQIPFFFFFGKIKKKKKKRKKKKKKKKKGGRKMRGENVQVCLPRVDLRVPSRRGSSLRCFAELWGPQPHTQNAVPECKLHLVELYGNVASRIWGTFKYLFLSCTLTTKRPSENQNKKTKTNNTRMTSKRNDEKSYDKKRGKKNKRTKNK